MKKLVSFKHFVIALAMTFAGLATFSACQDKSFDWDAAHADSAQKKFTNAFIEAFGEPAENHEWGFDLPWLKNESSITRGSIDWDESSQHQINKVENEYLMEVYHYGMVPNITAHENWEVFEWFSTHKVEWENTTRVVADGTKGEKLYAPGIVYVVNEAFELYGKTYNIGDEISADMYTWNLDASQRTKVSPADGYVEVTSTGTYSDAYIKKDGKLQKVTGTVTYDQNTKKAVVLVRFNETTKESTRNVNSTVAKKMGELSANNSLKQYTDLYWLDSPSVGVTMNFTHAWIQNVACDPLVRATGDPAVTPVRMSDDVELNLGGTAVTNNAMNQLVFHKSSSSSTYPDADTNDFNNGDNGWGYGNQSQVSLKDDARGFYSKDRFGNDIYKTGVLICGADFNNASVKVSQDEGARHDKWIIVYLKGDDYEGWYLGFDLEGGGTAGANEQIPANGYCNDWIVKLSAIGGPGYEPWDARIMCEDLGGEDNTVDLGGSFMTSDIDYNDIVIDIVKETGRSDVEITLQAAGGTLPLILSYKKSGDVEVPLFETHELFSNSNKLYEGNHTIPESEYRIMYNTGAEEGGSNSAQTVKLVFDDRATASSINGKTITINEAIPTGLDASAAFKAFMDKLQIKVYRHTTVDYLSSPSNGKNLTDADWQTLQNLKGQAPLMICVPRSTRWLKERQSIKLGYGGFPTWVQHPELYFWIPPGVNENFLY